MAAPPDAWITMKAKLALLTTKGIHASEVNVDTVNSQVTLHGKVQSASEKDLADKTVKEINGVQGVRNLLQVVPPRREKLVQRTDEQLKERVEKTLKSDQSLHDSSISVQSVNKGVVLLGGNAKTLADHLHAVETAARVPGVQQVASEIQSPDTVADVEIWRDRASRSASQKSGGIGGAARDVYVTSAAKMRLLADKQTPALDINVDTREGVVTLFGIVPSAQAKAAAAADVRKVSGVKRVVNELQVVPKAKQEAVKVRDDDLEHEVKKAFENHDELKDINVEVKNCVARLSGTVPSGLERLQAAVMARSTHGVCSVQDDLRVSN